MTRFKLQCTQPSATTRCYTRHSNRHSLSSRIEKNNTTGRPSEILFHASISLPFWGLILWNPVQSGQRLPPQKIKTSRGLSDSRLSEFAGFSGEQLTGLKENTLVDDDMFTDYTNEEGEWRTVKENGKDITLTVWTR